jgi:hypothetical protein
MIRQKLLHTLLAASFAALAMTATAQTTAPAQNNGPRNAPVGDAAAAPLGGAPGGTMAPANPAMNAPTPAMGSDMPRDMSGYRTARAACDKESMAGQEQCRNTLNTRYSGFAPKCQKLSGSALDDCLKGADHGQ